MRLVGLIGLTFAMALIGLIFWRSLAVSSGGTQEPPSPENAVSSGGEPQIVFDEVAKSIYPTKYDEALHVSAGKAFCTGDSGGPLFAQLAGKKRIQFGIAQSGHNEYTPPGKCRKPTRPEDYPDVYTEVNDPRIHSFITEHKAM